MIEIIATFVSTLLIFFKEELKEWFKGTGNAEIGDYQRSIMMELMPDLRVESTHTNSCMTTFTVDDLPLISRQSDRVVVAVAGCGRGAKCSDELGRMGAAMVLPLSAT